MTPQQKRRLIGVLGRLASDFAGERAAAGLLATKILREADLTWNALLQTECLSVAGRATSFWRDDLQLCLQNAGSLRPWEIEFTRNLDRQANASRKQRDVLAQIARRLREGGR